MSLKKRFPSSILRIPVEYTVSSIALSLSPNTSLTSGNDNILSASSTRCVVYYFSLTSEFPNQVMDLQAALSFLLTNQNSPSLPQAVCVSDCELSPYRFSCSLNSSPDFGISLRPIMSHPSAYESLASHTTK
ncbi:hypothetical protein LEP1GSC080_0291 [Leptospira interrogans str. FPW2026]|nr:hypothetical protein LEP1GSC080_0291 [Leptospira interrogans str. FPW2026]